MKTGVISCGGSNVTSVVNALSKIGLDSNLITAPGEQSDLLIMPGVGTFDTGIGYLESMGMFSEIQEHIARGKPFIGICLGMQMLFESSEEGTAKGLGVMDGSLEKLSKGAGGKFRSPPNIGYNYVNLSASDKFEDTPESYNGFYYFLHSYALKDKPEHATVVGQTKYNDKIFCPLFMSDNICGIQFHPERSGHRGLALLSWLIERMR